MVMSPVEGGLECKPTLVVVFKPEGAAPGGAEEGWGAPADCPEGTEAAAGCVVEPVGAGVRPMLEDIEASRKVQEKRGHSASGV
jgi:hypothetical protein